MATILASDTMATIPDLASIGPTVTLEIKCECANVRRVPIRLASDGLAVLRKHERGKLPKELPVMTYWCRHCKHAVVLTAGDLYLS
jgi:hypothetical protein